MKIAQKCCSQRTFTAHSSSAIRMGSKLYFWIKISGWNARRTEFFKSVGIIERLRQEFKTALHCLHPCSTNLCGSIFATSIFGRRTHLNHLRDGFVVRWTERRGDLKTQTANHRRAKGPTSWTLTIDNRTIRIPVWSGPNKCVSSQWQTVDRLRGTAFFPKKNPFSLMTLNWGCVRKVRPNHWTEALAWFSFSFLDTTELVFLVQVLASLFVYPCVCVCVCCTFGGDGVRMTGIRSDYKFYLNIGLCRVRVWCYQMLSSSL